MPVDERLPFYQLAKERYSTTVLPHAASNPPFAGDSAVFRGLLLYLKKKPQPQWERRRPPRLPYGRDDYDVLLYCPKAAARG